MPLVLSVPLPISVVIIWNSIFFIYYFHESLNFCLH